MMCRVYIGIQTNTLKLPLLTWIFNLCMLQFLQLENIGSQRSFLYKYTFYFSISCIVYIEIEREFTLPYENTMYQERCYLMDLTNEYGSLHLTREVSQMQLEGEEEGEKKKPKNKQNKRKPEPLEAPLVLCSAGFWW